MLLVVLVAACTSPLAAAGDRNSVASILERADKPDAPAPQVLAQDIIDLGTTALPKAIDALVAEAQHTGGLTSARARVVYATCTLAGSARWRPIVEARVVPGSTRATLSAACAVSGECGLSTELPLLVRAAMLDEPGEVRPQFEHALSRVLVRDDAGFDALDGLMSTASADVRSSIVAAVEGTREMEAATVLARWIATRREMRLMVLPHLSRLALALEKPFGDDVLQPVRALLDQAGSDTLPDAIVCAGRLGDYAAIPALTRWLREGEPGLRADALWSLRQISGLVFDEDAALWSKWFADETVWWEHESQADFAALRSGTRTDKVRVLREISAMHAWRDKLAEHIVVMLEDDDAELATFGARALGRLGSRLAVPALLDALDNPSESVAEAAHAALEDIARHKLPADAPGCREALGAHP